MVDLRNEIDALLSTIATTNYQYPEVLAQSSASGQSPPDDAFPCISFFDGHDLGNYYDGKPTTDDVAITVDCWEKINVNTGEFIEIHFQVDALLRANRYRQISFTPLYEGDVKVYHYSMQYKKIEEVD